ncbi:hypothetical protein V6N13_023904 [Hibiscus sabdariffa]|uniref:Secreted protein n=1 Tax=Hibiscus sabdariffa TaxID=183260 RepID=A0ABR2PN31_9ROSI
MLLLLRILLLFLSVLLLLRTCVSHVVVHDKFGSVETDPVKGDVEFLHLQSSAQRKKGKEKGGKDAQTKGNFAGSKNRFDALNGL